jgi:hypothetical protein
MERVNPHIIIPCSCKVEKTLFNLRSEGKLNAEIGTRLKHPLYCYIRKKNSTYREQYINEIEKWIEICY